MAHPLESAATALGYLMVRTSNARTLAQALTEIDELTGLIDKEVPPAPASVDTPDLTSGDQLSQ